MILQTEQVSDFGWTATLAILQNAMFNTTADGKTKCTADLKLYTSQACADACKSVDNCVICIDDITEEEVKAHITDITTDSIKDAIAKAVYAKIMESKTIDKMINVPIEKSVDEIIEIEGEKVIQSVLRMVDNWIPEVIDGVTTQVETNLFESGSCGKIGFQDAVVV